MALCMTLAPARASDDELDPAQDNPAGCTTATSEDVDGCGAQGREHFASAQHVPPVEACAGQSSDAGSVVTRVLPAGPVRSDGSLAFISGACVYLPPNYEDGTHKYPVLYVLHGGGGDQGNWVTMGSLQATLDEAYAADPANAVIAVSPDGRSGQWFDYYNRRFLNETYVLGYVVPYVDRHFRTIADRKARAIIGLSNGGYGSMHFAAKRPDLFRVAGSMSGNLGARGMGNLGTPAFEGGPAFQEAGSYYYGNVPAVLASNLDGVDLIVDWGATCMSDVTVDLCATWAFEQAFRGDNQHFRDELAAVGHKGELDYREAEGSHAWRWWTRWLRERHLPFVLERIADPMSAATTVTASSPPETFRYRSIFPTFSIWGYDVTVERKASEFLDLWNVSILGMTVQGSGRVVVRTAARYEKSHGYVVSGAGGTDQRIKADKEGRLSFSVDLGPSHTDEQYSTQGRAKEAAGGYWTVRNVVITPAR